MTHMLFLLFLALMAIVFLGLGERCRRRCKQSFCDEYQNGIDSDTAVAVHHTMRRGMVIGYVLAGLALTELLMFCF